MFSRFFVVLLVGLVGLPFLVSAYTETPAGSPLIISVYPKEAGPGQTANLTLNSFSFDLNRSEISWSVNGVEELRGLGKKNFSLTIGPTGTETKVNLVVRSPNGDLFLKQLSWRPLDLIVVWEADTYVPPFYKGKKMPSEGSLVRLLVLPEQSNQSLASNVFRWEYNGDPMVEETGRDQIAITKSSSYPGALSVETESFDGAQTAKTRIIVPLVNPLVNLYAAVIGSGPAYAKHLEGTISLASGELTLVAEPYFYPSEKIAGLRYDWSSLGQRLAAHTNDPRSLDIGQKEGAAGESEVALRVSDPKGEQGPLDKKIKIKLPENNF